jgi:hypothetical protein
MEMHLSYDVRPRLWFSVDGNYWRQPAGWKIGPISGFRGTDTILCASLMQTVPVGRR